MGVHGRYTAKKPRVSYWIKDEMTSKACILPSNERYLIYFAISGGLNPIFPGLERQPTRVLERQWLL